MVRPGGGVYARAEIVLSNHKILQYYFNTLNNATILCKTCISTFELLVVVPSIFTILYFSGFTFAMGGALSMSRLWANVVPHWKKTSLALNPQTKNLLSVYKVKNYLSPKELKPVSTHVFAYGTNNVLSSAK